MSLEIRFFQLTRGDEPVRQYLELIAEKDVASLSGCFHELKVHGRLEMPHGRPLTGHRGLFEVRYRRHRVLYCVHEGTAYLLHAFMKKSQETPKKEFDTALARMKQLGLK